MNIKYKIVEVHEDNRTMVVRYYTDIVTESELDVMPNSTENTSPARCKTDISLNIPLPEPTEDELHKIILRHVPLEALRTFENMKTQPDNAVLSVVHTIKNITFTKTEQQISEMFTSPSFTDAEINQLIQSL
jgi:hypothetical protein